MDWGKKKTVQKLSSSFEPSLYVSKLLERVVAEQLVSHLNQHDILENSSQHTAQDTVVRLPNFVSLITSCAVQVAVTGCFSLSWILVLHSTPLTRKFS